MMSVEKSVLQRVFGDDPFIKIVDTLLDHPNYEYTKTDLAEVNDISRSTVYSVWNRIEELEIVQESHDIGNTTMFKLNTESRVVKALYQFERIVEGSAKPEDSDNKIGESSA